MELIEKSCPRYLIPTTLDKKRGICVPDYALAEPGSEEAEKISVILQRIQISNTKMLDPDLILEGTKYILDKAVQETFWQKTWSEHLNSYEDKKKQRKEEEEKTQLLERERLINRLLGSTLKYNQKLARIIIPPEKFPKIFPGLDTPQTYVDFIQAIGKFPQVCRSWRGCGKELAAMGAFADQARCAGEPSHFSILCGIFCACQGG